MPQASREVTVCNEQGMHARPAMKVADVANDFASEVKLLKLSRGAEEIPDESSPLPAEADGKSIMALLQVLGLKGAVYRIEADGDDAHAAVDALARLFANKFEED